MSNDTIDQIVEASRIAARHAKEGNTISALLYRNEAWQLENGNWQDWIRLEDSYKFNCNKS